MKSSIDWLFRVLAVAGLAVDAYVHWHLAHGYSSIGRDISVGAVFRAEAGTAVLAAVGLLVSDRRAVWNVAGVVAALALVAVVVYRFVDIPAFGPFPSMYEPAWFPEKSLAALAEGAVCLIWLTREACRTISFRAPQPVPEPGSR